MTMFQKARIDWHFVLSADATHGNDDLCLIKSDYFLYLRATCDILNRTRRGDLSEETGSTAIRLGTDSNDLGLWHRCDEGR